MTSGWKSRLGKRQPRAQYRVLQPTRKADRRNRRLKRTQKGSEGEPTGCGHSAVNGMSPELVYLSDPAQGLFTLEGNTSRRAHGKLRDTCWPGAGCVNGARPDLRGGELNRARIQYCVTTRGNGWQTGNTNRILTRKEFALLTRSGEVGWIYNGQSFIAARLRLTSSASASAGRTASSFGDQSPDGTLRSSTATSCAASGIWRTRPER